MTPLPMGRAMADRLYLLRPGFLDNGEGPFFCGECALVEGMLSFFPEIREKVQVRYVEYARPRPDIVAELGPEHQSAPVLVLGDGSDHVPGTVQVKSAHGKRFIDEPNQICVYLAARHGAPRPHH
jgi:hypothetical protein